MSEESTEVIRAESKPVSVEQSFTLEDIRERIVEILNQHYGEHTEDPLKSLNRGKNLLEVLKITLDNSIGRRQVDLNKIHSGPYTLTEVKAAISEISPKYHHPFDTTAYENIESLVSKWIKAFPNPEVASEGDFMAMLCGK